MAYALYPTDGLSSRQYASLFFGLRCREAGFRPSMGSARDAYDNRLWGFHRVLGH
jgi:hypothetical protein